MSYRLLSAFEALFSGKAYRHRKSNQGDFLALEFYEDLYSLGKAAKLIARVNKRELVVHIRNIRAGVRARRGDGTFGEVVPGVTPVVDPGYAIARGEVATVEVGVEAKVLHKAMIKQIDRVMNDLLNQVKQFRRGTGSQPLCVALVGVNHAAYTVGYEGDRTYRTDGKENRHPISEAAEAIARIDREVRPAYDELLILPYVAFNEAPFEFKWVDAGRTEREYAAALTRISRAFDARF